MTDIADAVTAWDGKFIHTTTRTLAEAGVAAGTLQYWDEHGVWTPGKKMKYPADFPFVNAPTALPTLTALDPVEGPSGIQVEVTGTNFNEGSVVLFGAQALATDYIGPTLLVAFVPESVATATYSVTVRNPDGDTTAALTFDVTE